MRFDSIGMFWEDLPSVRSSGIKVERPMPKIPEEATWQPPTEFPN